MNRNRKNVVRLTESKLYNIIKEPVRQILREQEETLKPQGKRESLINKITELVKPDESYSGLEIFSQIGKNGGNMR